MRTITSRHNPLVARFRAAARGETADAVLLDGAHLVLEALDAALHVRAAAVTSEAAARIEVPPVLDRMTRAGTDLIVVSRAVMDVLSPVKSSSGLVAIADRPAVPADRIYSGATPLVVIAVDVQDPGNVGAMVRVLEAAGATGFVASGACADPFGWKAIRGSMGSALRLPIVQNRDPARASAEARNHRSRIIAAVPRDGAPLCEVDYAGPTAILIGGEGAGLDASLVAAADECVTIPMQSPVESLNVAVTTALIVYEAFRQRAGQRSRLDANGLVVP